MIKKTLFKRGAVLLTAINLLLVARAPTFATDAKLINIQPVGKDKLIGFQLAPVNLQIKKNTFVIWQNGVQGEDIQVIFMDGKTCREVSSNAKEFSLDAKDCYVTTFMSFGKTSGLQFVESGNYQYYIATATGNIKAKGSIIVRGK